ncbi:procollagen galactosyltransferase 1-like [Liolophura sinensis]|uniref:procollagen galactosyltransferase 1-like n=1 Tax=Liolophura sinensis TaxID=3198878 RepID=UPI003158F0A8
MAASMARVTFDLSWPNFLLILACFVCQILPLCGQIRYADTETIPERKPTVFVVLLVRNKAHALPYFFGYMENLDYPKERIAWWIRSDHNSDNTSAVLREWVRGIGHQYHSIDIEINDTQADYEGERGPCHWTTERFTHVMATRQAGLDAARKHWADFAFMLDSDVLIENPKTLSMLIDQRKTIVAPMLNSSLESTYANFWGGMRENGYYQRVRQYFTVLYRHRGGLFEVPMVHSALLINLRHQGSEKLAYDPAPPGYEGPYDDIIRFAFSAKAAGIKMHLLNTDYFGHVMIPLQPGTTLQDEIEGFTHVKAEAMVNGDPLIHSPHIYVEDIPADKLGFDQVYMINLKRRPERRDRMLRTLKVMGIEAHLMDAVDGKQINETFIEEQGISMLPGYADPYHKRPMTMGEIGCFLSHYNIWMDVIKNGYNRIAVFEDDVRFEAYFRTRLFNMLLEVEKALPEWDLIYLGRKRLYNEEELFVDGTDTVVYPLYSYWTLSYLLTNRGAQKLLDQKPLTKLLPVDEYLPIMFDQHPTDDWKKQFHPRDLVGLSAAPLLVYPTHYTGEDNYISDTEDSVVVDKGDNDPDDIDDKEKTEDFMPDSSSTSATMDSLTDVKDEL